MVRIGDELRILQRIRLLCGLFAVLIWLGALFRLAWGVPSVGLVRCLLDPRGRAGDIKCPTGNLFTACGQIRTIKVICYPQRIHVLFADLFRGTFHVWDLFLVAKTCWSPPQSPPQEVKREAQAATHFSLGWASSNSSRRSSPCGFLRWVLF